MNLVRESPHKSGPSSLSDILLGKLKEQVLGVVESLNSLFYGLSCIGMAAEGKNTSQALRLS